MGLKLSAQARREVIQQMTPRYQQASASCKGVLLDEVVATTGYARRSAVRLLNHPPQGSRPQKRRRQATYGPEVQHMLFLLWHQANRICTKRLMPFLPTLIESLERHEHLHLTEACRSQLLSMSAATADRLLHAPRRQSPHGIALTRAGTLLKQQIPIRTFQQWNEQEPGFLEADLVAHCGVLPEGSFLYTLTLTDIATGWTECFPLFSKSAEAVVSALEQARACFPFPILGLDTDNGSEFINNDLLAYCEAEQISFTRGREGLKNDQCFVEQKNGAIVRQVIGYDRLEGDHAYRQLGEVYQALRLYVNGFQPSMKLQAKQYDGRKVRRVYDTAKTPLQRLLLSQVLSASKAHELQQVAQVLDPLRLFHHLQDLQQALLGSTTNVSPDAEGAVLPFFVQRCIAGPRAALESVEGSWQEEEVHTGAADSVLSERREHEPDHHTPFACAIPCSSSVAPSLQTVEESSSPSQSTSEATRRPATTNGVAVQCVTVSSTGQPQAPRTPVRLRRSRHTLSVLTLEQTAYDYLEDQRSHHRRPKTLEWHRKSLGLFQHYLRTEHECVLLGQLTEAQVRDWLVWLSKTPIVTGHPRSSSTVESYARSARAFCQWLVHKKYLQTTPFVFLSMPSMEIRSLCLLSLEEWESLLLACQPPKKTKRRAEQAIARNRALLWVLFDTGMQASEICRLRLGDVDREQGVLNVRWKGSKERRLTLGQQALRHLLVYLDGYRLPSAACGEQADANEEPLFLSERGRPLTKSGVALLFGRLRKRAGITRKGVTASLLRESFAARYLRAGGDLGALRELLGQEKSTSFQHYWQMSDGLDPSLWTPFSAGPVEGHTVAGDPVSMVVEPYVTT